MSLALILIPDGLSVPLLFRLVDIRFRLHFLHANRISTHILTVEVFHRCLGFSGGGHFNKSKPLGSIGPFIQDQRAGLHLAVHLE